jgi:hypothetical protein
LQANETLLKTVGEIALIGSRGLNAVRLATRWTDQVYVIHELPVGGTAISAKPMPISFPALPAASQAATSSRFLRVELWRSPAPGAELLSRTLSVFAGGVMRRAARHFRSLRFDCVLPDDERDGGCEKDRSNRGGDGFRSELQAVKGTGGRMRQ